MNLVDRIGAGGIAVNGRDIATPFILAPGFLREDWIGGIAALDAGALEPLWELSPRIVLLGGTPVPPDRLRPLRALFASRQVALEAMDLGAACRTYNVLAQEDRAVAALLFP